MTTSRFKFFWIHFCNPVVRIANRITWRFGRHYRHTFESAKPFLSGLKPGMVILTRTDYIFGNLFIHGYWTHSGLVISETELIEAVGCGVRKTTLEDFFSKVDDFSVFHPLSVEPETSRTACEFAKSAIGLTYNFTFRRKPRSYYCSELIYLSFEEGLRTCKGVLDYTEYGRPYWEKKMIITPDWLVASPLEWKKLDTPPAPLHPILTTPEHVPFPGRTRELLHLEAGRFHSPEYCSL